MFVKLLTSQAIVLAASTFVQVQAQPNPYSGRYRAIFSDHAFGGGLRPITGAPFSAEQVFQGDRVTGHERLYRDAQGRIRNERSMTRSKDGIPLIYIDDPVSGYRYMVDIVNKVAHRIKYPSPPLNPGAVSVLDLARCSFHNDTVRVGIPPQAKAVSEALGLRTVCEIQARGVKTTYTLGMENDGTPSTITTEAWVSDELKVLVLSKRVDSRNRESTTRLISFLAGKSDPALFRPPTDCVLVDEKGSFALDILVPAS
jgi:hypothetical protein